MQHAKHICSLQVNGEIDRLATGPPLISRPVTLLVSIPGKGRENMLYIIFTE